MQRKFQTMTKQLFKVSWWAILRLAEIFVVVQDPNFCCPVVPADCHIQMLSFAVSALYSVLSIFTLQIKDLSQMQMQYLITLFRQ